MWCTVTVCGRLGGEEEGREVGTTAFSGCLAVRVEMGIKKGTGGRVRQGDRKTGSSENVPVHTRGLSVLLRVLLGPTSPLTKSNLAPQEVKTDRKKNQNRCTPWLSSHDTAACLVSFTVCYFVCVLRVLLAFQPPLSIPALALDPASGHG